MKKFLFRAGASVLLCVCGTAFADRVIIKEAPIRIEREGKVYVAPTGVALTGDRFIFDTDTGKRVCFKTVQPAYSKIDLGAFAVRVKDSTVNFYCYSYDTEYFSTE